MATFFSIIGEILSSVWTVFTWVWWIVLPIWLFNVLFDIYMKYIRVRFFKGVKYVLFELRVPKDLIKTPKSMENIFSTFHATRMSVSEFKKKYIKGEAQLWLSLEIVGNGGGISFYIRTPEQFRNLVEAQIYAQYPSAELSEVPDYVDFVPKDIPNKYFDCWGADFGLAKDAAYPIKTYEYFEEVKEEKRIDPISSIVETMSKLKGDQKIWIQILIKYTDDSWKKTADEAVNKLAGKKGPKKEMGFGEYVGQFAVNLMKAPVVVPEWDFGGDNKDEGTSKISHLTKGEKDIIEAIQNKTAKLGFESFLRFLYIDKRETFNRQNINSIMGALQQFSTQNLNSFKIYKPSSCSAEHPFKAQKEFLKKRMLYTAYRLRMFNPGIKAVLNTEELATIYHFPIMSVEAPFLRRIEAKKGEPPINLPISD
ncbi:MAG TPA: hypothetical protein PLM70_08500 [Bacteroidales bacterium]|nr:hypothetical protein [Bacteroidales bacterium]